MIDILNIETKFTYCSHKICDFFYFKFYPSLHLIITIFLLFYKSHCGFFKTRNAKWKKKLPTWTVMCVTIFMLFTRLLTSCPSIHWFYTCSVTSLCTPSTCSSTGAPGGPIPIISINYNIRYYQAYFSN